ncbi:hypothetical protein GCM10023226_27130 [Nocardioides nanhaiensis]|uniref:YCII-related domain-containing protein n=1 Tax=Nocardioides nanhaiensis TaxID=1476871 RepID=A0ABP8WE25_9ACTN
MPLYAAIIYTHDTDWTAPGHAAEMGEYGAFSASAAEILRGGAALFPTAPPPPCGPGARAGRSSSPTGRTRRPRRCSPGSS